MGAIGVAMKSEDLTWRNFYMRHRRNIFAGFRTVSR
jgi:hypothetical protein